MGKRERYTTNIQCAECGAKGTGTFTELENPVFARGGDLRRETESLGDGFELGVSGPIRAKCCGCGSSNVDQV